MPAFASTYLRVGECVALLFLALVAGLLPATRSSAAIGEVLTYPAGARTGNAKVDRVIAAWQRKDAQTLTKLIKYVSLPCTEAFQFSFPVCLPDEEPGTRVKTFLVGGCSFSWVRQPDAYRRIQSFLTADHRLFAAQSNPTVFWRRFHSKYSVVLAIRHPQLWETSAIWLDKDGRIRAINFTHCGETPCDVLRLPAWGGRPYLLPPREACPPVTENGTTRETPPAGPAVAADPRTVRPPGP